MVKRVLVGYGIDVDAGKYYITALLWRLSSRLIKVCRINKRGGCTEVSRGIFGATVGVDRLLKLWEKYKIKATWFIPAHSVESFPEQMAKIRDAGHEIGLHGYTHEFVSTLSEEQERDVLAKSIEVLTNLTGKKPKGWTAPAWDTSKSTIRLLEEAGIEYDHSFMHHDSQMYYVPDGTHTWEETNPEKKASEWMVPMSKLRASKIVEVPANWHLDDWPPFQPFSGANSHGFVDPGIIERLWKEQFDFLYREYDSFVFPMSIHPQVSGKPQVILMHERLIEYINSHEGVEWCTMEQMVKEFKDGKMGEITIQGGVDV